MKDITFLNAKHELKNSISTPFTFKSADKAENIRVKGSEKCFVSLRNGSKKWLGGSHIFVTTPNQPQRNSI